jgi:hypothetical protein
VQTHKLGGRSARNASAPVFIDRPLSVLPPAKGGVVLDNRCGTMIPTIASFESIANKP